MTQFEEVNNKLAPEKFYQIPVDGSKVNLSFAGKWKQSALKVFTIHLLTWALLVGTLCMVLLNLVLKEHPGGIKDILKHLTYCMICQPEEKIFKW